MSSRIKRQYAMSIWSRTEQGKVRYVIRKEEVGQPKGQTYGNRDILIDALFEGVRIAVE